MTESDTCEWGRGYLIGAEVTPSTSTFESGLIALSSPPRACLARLPLPIDPPGSQRRRIYASHVSASQPGVRCRIRPRVELHNCSRSEQGKVSTMKAGERPPPSARYRHRSCSTVSCRRPPSAAPSSPLSNDHRRRIHSQPAEAQKLGRDVQPLKTRRQSVGQVRIRTARRRPLVSGAGGQTAGP